MKKTKSIALILGVLVMSLVISYFAIAWQEPTVPPPQEQVPAPINVGSVTQTKAGGLNILGDVGIGTPSPGARLDIGNAGSLFLSGHITHSARVELGQGRTADGYAYIDFVGDTTYTDYGLRLLRGNTGLNTWSDLVHRGTGELRIRSVEAAPISLWTSNARRIHITSGGNVGIGTIDPGTYKLRVEGNVAATAFYYTSDAGLKKNIEPLSDSLEKILSLQGASFNWKDSDEPSIGLIAQEVEKIFPEAVSGSEGEKTIDYAKLIAPMIEAIKEQQKEIEALKAIIQ